MNGSETDAARESTQDTEGGLKRTLSLWQVTMSGIGIVVGAGIYVLIGSASAEAGNAVWLAFVLAAVMCGFTALSYAELASMFPSAAAEYEFARQAFNEFIGFVAGWAMLVAYIIAAAAIAIGFAHYAGHFVDVERQVAAVALLIVLTAVVAGGIQTSIWFSAVLVALQIGGLLLVIVAGAPHVGDRDLLEGATFTGVAGGAALVFFAFIGFDDIVTLAEETNDPRRNMPRALVLTLAGSTALYVLVGVAAVSVLGGEALAASERPLTDVIATKWGDRAGDIVAVIAIASTVNATLLVLTAGSRILYGMARRGALPRVLSTVGRESHSPWIAALVVLVPAIAFALIGRIEVVASATDFAVYVVFILTNLSLIMLRWRWPDAPRGFKSPGRVWILPLTPVLALISVTAMITFLDLEAWIIGGSTILSGVALWWLLPRLRVSAAFSPPTPRDSNAGAAGAR